MPRRVLLAVVYAAELGGSVCAAVGARCRVEGCRSAIEGNRFHRHFRALPVVIDRRLVMSCPRQTIFPGALALALCTATVTATVALAPNVVRAQDDEYRRTVEEALAEFESGSFAESLALFRRAHGMRPSARTFRGLGKACFELRRYVDAVTYFTEALESTINPLSPEQRAEVTGLRSRAQAFLGRYTVTTFPEDATISVDGNDAPHEFILDIGDHTIAASAAGFVTATRRINVAGGEDETLTMRLESSVADVVIEERVVDRVVERVREDPGEPLRIAGWAIGGLGVAGLALGAAFDVAGYDANQTFAAAVNSMPPLCTAEGMDLMVSVPGSCAVRLNNWHTYETLGDVFYVSGSILAGSGLLLLIIGYVMEPHDPPAADTGSGGAPTARDVARGIEFLRGGSRPTLSIGCGPFADLGVACTGRF